MRTRNMDSSARTPGRAYRWIRRSNERRLAETQAVSYFAVLVVVTVIGMVLP